MDIAEAEKLIEELEAKTANLKEMVADYGKVSNQTSKRFLLLGISKIAETLKREQTPQSNS